MNDVIIIGGGLAGLTAATVLARAGKKVVVLEKGSYPSHKVCGEYISNETLPFLRSIGADPAPLNPARITQFKLSSVSGKSLQIPLDLGGFGISRYVFDKFLADIAASAGAEILTQQKVYKTAFANNFFTVHAQGQQLQARVVIGAFGKRSNLDRELDRPFLQKRSPYVGVKHHIKMPFPSNLIGLHNFNGGYAGLGAIEEGKQCFCYLVHRNVFRQFRGTITLEAIVLSKNPHLLEVIQNAEYLFETPEIINEISFEKKEPVLNHMLMAGDAAGMVAPLFGNGMAMAIHQGKLSAEAALGFFSGSLSRAAMENAYKAQWQKNFTKRLWLGRNLQKAFGKAFISEAVVGVAKSIPGVAAILVRNSHGQRF